MAGIDHVSATLEQREKLSLVRGQVQAMMPRIVEQTGCAAVLLATCSRTELYLHAEDERELPDAAEVLCETAGAAECRPFLTLRTGGEAVRHLMQVSAGMQSQIFGDNQIVSQVKDAAALARELKTTDAVLDTLFRLTPEALHPDAAKASENKAKRQARKKPSPRGEGGIAKQ